MLYNVAIMQQSLTRDIVPTEAIAFHVRKQASNRIEALEKALPQITKEVLPLVIDPTIKYISVKVGQVGNVTGSAGRLSAIAIITATGKIR